MKESPIRLSHILPRKDLFDGQRVLPLSDPKFFGTIVASLREWVATRKPSIIKEHRRDGESYGEVVGIVEDERGIFAQVRFIPEAEAKLAEGKIKYVSGTFVFNHKADDFTDKGVWPCSLLELSMVSVPRHSRQISMQHLNQLSESDVVLEGYVTQFNSVLTPTDTFIIEEETDMDLDKLNELLESLLADAMAPLLDRIAKLEAAADEVAPKEPEVQEEVKEAEVDEAKAEDEAPAKADEDEGQAEGDVKRAEEKEAEEATEASEEAPEDEESKLSEPVVDLTRELEKRAVLAEARVAELEADIRLRDAHVVVAGDIASRPHMSSMSEKLVKIYMSDKDLYTEVLGVVPESTSSLLSERVAVGYAHVDAKPSNPYKAATALAKAEGISYTEALSRVS